MKIQDLLPSDRPREKLWQQGVESLGVNELIAILLGTGSAGCSALELANRLLRDCEGLQALARMSAPRLTRLTGIKQAKAARLAAALEIGRRAGHATTQPPAASSPREVASYLRAFQGTGEVEEFGVIALDARHRVKRCRILSRGTLNGTLVHPREVFHEALLSQAAALIVFHNHPSGDPTPSREDQQLTRRLSRAGRLMGIELLDHLVLGEQCYFSFQEQGVLPDESRLTERGF